MGVRMEDLAFPREASRLAGLRRMILHPGTPENERRVAKSSLELLEEKYRKRYHEHWGILTVEVITLLMDTDGADAGKGD